MKRKWMENEPRTKLPRYLRIVRGKKSFLLSNSMLHGYPMSRDRGRRKGGKIKKKRKERIVKLRES